MLVAEVQRLAGVGDDLDRAAGRDGAVGAHDVAKGDAVDVLHDDVRHRTGGGLGLAGVVHADDRRMVQRGGILGLPAKAHEEARVARQVGAQDLDRDVAVQSHVTREVDFGHPAHSEDLPEFVAVRQNLRRRHDRSPDVGARLPYTCRILGAGARPTWRGIDGCTDETAG